jgi:hypothetical protein
MLLRELCGVLRGSQLESLNRKVRRGIAEVAEKSSDESIYSVTEQLQSAGTTCAKRKSATRL